MSWSALALVGALCGCGRFAFDPHEDAAHDAPAGTADSRTIDALSSDLVAWFPLDDANGAVQFDDMVAHHNGTCTPPQCPTSGPGHLGTAFHFDGADDCIAIADVGQLDPPQITITLWANSDVVAANMSQISKRDDSTALGLNSWQLETIINGDQEAFTGDHSDTTNHQIISPAATIRAGVWQHLAATFDGTTRILYIDGVAQATDTQPPLSHDANPALIGCDDNGGFGEHFQGSLDDIRIYNHALNAAEITALASE